MKEHLKANFFFKQLIKRAFVSGVCACPSIKLQLPPSYLSTPHTLSMLFINTTHSFLSLVFFSPLSFPNSTNHYINSSYFTTQHNTHKSSFKVFFFFFNNFSSYLKQRMIHGPFIRHKYSYGMRDGCFGPLGLQPGPKTPPKGLHRSCLRSIIW